MQAAETQEFVQTYCNYNADDNVNVSIAVSADDSRRLTGVDASGALAGYEGVDGVDNKGSKNECFMYSYYPGGCKGLLGARL